MSTLRRLVTLVVTLFLATFGMASVATASPAYTHHPHLSCKPFRPYEHHFITCHGDGYLRFDFVHVNLVPTPKAGLRVAVATAAKSSYHLINVHASKRGAFTFTHRLPRGVVGPALVVGTGRGGAKTDRASDNIIIRKKKGGNGTGGKHGHHGNGNGDHGLSTTGFAIIGSGVLALGLLVGGILLVLSARRRRIAA